MGKADQGLNSGKSRYQVIPRVLVFLRNKEDVLLLKGAPEKRIWANLYNGVGGHIEPGEDIYSAAIREVYEETKINPSKLELKAIANIDVGNASTGITIFVFVGWSQDREIVSSYEGDLHWFPVSDLPREELVEDLDWLLPRVLNMSHNQFPLYLHYSYDDDDRLVIKQA